MPEPPNVKGINQIRLEMKEAYVCFLIAHPWIFIVGMTYSRGQLFSKVIGLIISHSHFLTYSSLNPTTSAFKSWTSGNNHNRPLFIFSDITCWNIS